MVQVYNILDSIRDHFRNDGITKTVSYGDLPEIDNDKTTIFPLSHMDIENAVFDNNIITFTINILTLDQIDHNKSAESEDEFFGNDNLHDVYNTQFVVMTKLINSLRRGALNDLNIKLGEEPTVEPYEDRFEGMLAGWLAQIEIQVPNDISKGGC